MDGQKTPFIFFDGPLWPVNHLERYEVCIFSDLSIYNYGPTWIYRGFNILISWFVIFLCYTRLKIHLRSNPFSPDRPYKSYLDYIHSQR